MKNTFKLEGLGCAQAEHPERGAADVGIAGFGVRGDPVRVAGFPGVGGKQQAEDNRTVHGTAPVAVRLR